MNYGPYSNSITKSYSKKSEFLETPEQKNIEKEIITVKKISHNNNNNKEKGKLLLSLKNRVNKE